MQIEIEFRPEKGTTQTLYADLSREEVEAIEAAIASRDASDTILQINSRTKRNGPPHRWTFRADRIDIKRVR
ncbi:hypothetical protein BJF79_03455 [Actinomadura sp. CNU-125]|uniref:hypothetical protein n=1 Tax=Actinomadura sp. CNU-125 TaxID=1904961 RepID=UPI00096138AD|nr:hypothetical protein [Actinomadura sp. CNU-125]OLT12970.1 hypothetical protein BJF79_03455 [Actinomadura sp. CNU-125]